MQKIKNILVDYGNVIYMIDFIELQHAFNQLGIPNVGEIFAHSGQIKLFDDFDKGVISSADFRDGIRKLTNNASLSDAQIDHAWNALLIGVPAGKHEILLQLKERYRTFLLSNNNAIHYAHCMASIKSDYGIEDNSVFFEQTYYSHLVGMRKPNEDIFQFVLHEQGLLPEETLFIDDSPQHLKTAESLGIHTALCSMEHPLEEIVKEWKLLE
ncbi:HAD family hydrolase [Sphingobacterium rhinopitheci]|uniref:HAD family hydrolase n=1 Tax=Sphingobacterium rhinopitheci TaxID=2781960 RepID=UPI001F519C39|nr:HAD family phosphatase [Sphingobacterium rhinopitheci]MCI0922699.1 HAD family phosphatase [Sphingobacterium rhinopitheci]